MTYSFYPVMLMIINGVIEKENDAYRGPNDCRRQNPDGAEHPEQRPAHLTNASRGTHNLYAKGHHRYDNSSQSHSGDHLHGGVNSSVPGSI